VEPQEVDEMLRTLLRITVQQDTINQDIRACLQEQREFNRQQGGLNDRLTAAIEHLDVTQARIETLIARMLPQSETGREA
jgi:uncharacterized protein VirK/YbjX